jgi:hypothetical protein
MVECRPAVVQSSSLFFVLPGYAFIGAPHPYAACTQSQQKCLSSATKSSRRPSPVSLVVGWRSRVKHSAAACDAPSAAFGASDSQTNLRLDWSRKSWLYFDLTHMNTGLVEAARSNPRKFSETIELQIGLKNYDPQKDKRFSGSVKLPYIPRPRMKVRHGGSPVLPWFQPSCGSSWDHLGERGLTSFHHVRC